MQVLTHNFFFAHEPLEFIQTMEHIWLWHKLIIGPVLIHKFCFYSSRLSNSYKQWSKSDCVTSILCIQIFIHKFFFEGTALEWLQTVKQIWLWHELIIDPSIDSQFLLRTWAPRINTNNGAHLVVTWAHHRSSIDSQVLLLFFSALEQLQTIELIWLWHELIIDPSPDPETLLQIWASRITTKCKSHWFYEKMNFFGNSLIFYWKSRASLISLSKSLIVLR